MKSSIRDMAKGTFHEIKGKTKEIAGKLSDNPKLEAEGIAEKNAGKVQKKIGQIKDVFEEDWFEEDWRCRTSHYRQCSWFGD